MLDVLDYRNGRYQGQTLFKQPHGVGIFLTLNFTFIVAYWKHGKIDGKALVVYANGSMFAGEIY